MANNNTVLAVGVGAMLFYLVSRTGQGIIDSVSGKIGIGRISYKNFTLQFAQIGFDVSIEFINNFSFGIPIEGFQGGVFYTGKQIASVNVAGGAQIIPANSSQELNFRVSASTTDLAQDIYDIFQSGNYIDNFTLIGTVYSNGFSIPINQRIVKL